MDDHHEALRALIDKNNLTYRRAAELARISETTVKSYLRPRGTGAARPAPLGVVELIALKLAADRILAAAGTEGGNPLVRDLAEARGGLDAV